MAWLTRSSGSGVRQNPVFAICELCDEAGRFTSLVLCFFINEMGRIRFSVSWGLLCGCSLQPQIGSDLRRMMSQMHQKGIKYLLQHETFWGRTGQAPKLVLLWLGVRLG